jgi:hypothetical protein
LITVPAGAVVMLRTWVDRAVAGVEKRRAMLGGGGRGLGDVDRARHRHSDRGWPDEYVRGRLSRFQASIIRCGSAQMSSSSLVRVMAGHRGAGGRGKRGRVRTCEAR